MTSQTGSVRRGRKAATASAWTDQATAQGCITHALRTHEQLVRIFAAGPRTNSYLSLYVTAESPIGRCVWVDADGERHRGETTFYVVKMAHTGNGVAVATSYPERPRA